MKYRLWKVLLMYSMTGYGRGEYKKDGIEVAVEVKTVNNRFLDIAIKCPRSLLSCDDMIRKTIREKLTRGHIDVFISYADKREKEKSYYLDEQICAAYIEATKKLCGTYPDIANDVSVTSILKFPDVIKADETSAADDELVAAVKEALVSSLDKLNGMRKTEGDKLEKDMLSRVDVIEGLVMQVRERAPFVVENYRAKLDATMQKLLAETEIDESRILTEVALFADKCNIDEEMTRLVSHISQFRSICNEEIVGRKLDFLVQEFNRESNTICSKSNDIEVTRLGLALKNEIEKVREQVQNVE